MVFKDYPMLKHKIFQQDNAPCHRRENVLPRLHGIWGMKWEDIPTFIWWWPPQSPDLSPIENFFATVDDIKKEMLDIMSLSQMREIINCILNFENPHTPTVHDEVFANRVKNVLRKCLLSWPDRLASCIDLEGGWTKY